MNFRTRFEKFYNRQYFAFEYLSDMPIVVTRYVIDIIAKLIDRCFPNAHLYARITENRENPMSKSINQVVGFTFVPALRGVVLSSSGMLILTIIHFILCFVGHCIGNTSFVVDGVGIGLFASFFIAFLIDYFFSLRHNKYEKYREEYLMEKTSHKVLWTLCVFMLILLDFIICCYFFAAANSDKIAEYIVSLMK